jgi:hypothetical protein
MARLVASAVFLQRRFPAGCDRVAALSRLLDRHCGAARRQMGLTAAALEAFSAACAEAGAAAWRTVDFCRRAEACYRLDGSVDEAAAARLRAEWEAACHGRP